MYVYKHIHTYIHIYVYMKIMFKYSTHTIHKNTHVTNTYARITWCIYARRLNYVCI